MYLIIFKIFNSHNISNNTNICELFYYSSYLKNFFNSSKNLQILSSVLRIWREVQIVNINAFFVDNALQRRHLIISV